MPISFFLISHRDFRPTTLGKKQEKIRLRIYKIYAWGFPLLITIIAAIMDNLPDAQHLLRPRFGEITCWFVGECVYVNLIACSLLIYDTIQYDMVPFGVHLLHLTFDF